MKRYRVKLVEPWGYDTWHFALQRRFLWFIWITIKRRYNYHIVVRDIDPNDIVKDIIS